jgi:hypothetical protein
MTPSLDLNAIFFYQILPSPLHIVPIMRRRLKQITAPTKSMKAKLYVHGRLPTLTPVSGQSLSLHSPTPTGVLAQAL